MKIIDSNQYRYERFSDGYHVFMKRDLSGYEAYKEAKIIIRPANVVLIALPDGKVSVSYATMRRYTLDEVCRFVEESEVGLRNPVRIIAG